MALEGKDNNTESKKPPISPRPKDCGDIPDVKPVKKKKKKKLPDSQDVDQTDETGETKPRRRRRSQSASQDTDAEVNECSNLSSEKPVTPKKKKRRPKLQTTDGDQDKTKTTTETKEDVGGSKASLLTNGTAASTPRKKKGKKKKATGHAVHADDEYLDNGLAADLACVNDDIIKDNDLKEEPLSLVNLQNKANLRSEPTPKVYIEINRGFKKESKTQYAKRVAAQEVEKIGLPEPSRQTTIDFALSVHRVLKTFCLFIHGLTAGMALWHVVIVYVLSAYDDFDFLSHYQPLALPVQCVFYLLLVFCTVSACDRWDIGNLNVKFLLKAVTLHNGAVSILIYFAAIIVSVTVVSTEDRIHLYYTNEDLWKDQSVRESELSSWRIMNTARGVLAILGWFVLSITPNADRLRKSLQEGDDDDVLLGNEVCMISPA